MAVFLINICKFNGCGIKFPTLGDLIQHIEDTHLDYDPKVLEKQELQPPPCLPLSYILRFFTDAARKENMDLTKRRQRALSPAVSVRSTTPTGSELDDDELLSESEDSNDSWTTQEELSTAYILRHGSRMMRPSNTNEEKPFACPVPGCKKRYKNVNGIKYHAKNGHRKESRVKKAYKCQCGKSYKTSKGFRNHAASHHGSAAIVPSNGEPLLDVSSISPTVVHPPTGGQTLSPTNHSTLPSCTSNNANNISNNNSSSVSVNGNGLTIPVTVGLPTSYCGLPTSMITPPPSASPLRSSNPLQAAALVNYSPLTPTSPNTPHASIPQMKMSVSQV